MNKGILNIKKACLLVYDSGMELSRDYGSVHAAALGYYILLSVFPLATLSAIIITRIIGPATLAGDYEVLLSAVIGAQYSKLLQSLITSSYSVASNNVWTIVNILVLIYASSYMFYQARISLDAMWHLTPKPGVANTLLATAKTYTFAYIIALLVGLSFLVLLFWNTLWNIISELITKLFSINLSGMESFLDVFSSPLIYTLIFMAAFRYLPQARMRKRDMLPGSILTAILYWVGNYLYAYFLGYSTVGTIYGIASSTVVFLFWVFYSAMIFLFGAKFTRLYALRFGNGLKPDENMMCFDSPNVI
jgi:membrane protein